MSDPLELLSKLDALEASETQQQNAQWDLLLQVQQQQQLQRLEVDQKRQQLALQSQLWQEKNRKEEETKRIQQQQQNLSQEQQTQLALFQAATQQTSQQQMQQQQAAASSVQPQASGQYAQIPENSPEARAAHQLEKAELQSARWQQLRELNQKKQMEKEVQEAQALAEAQAAYEQDTDLQAELQRRKEEEEAAAAAAECRAANDDSGYKPPEVRAAEAAAAKAAAERIEAERLEEQRKKDEERAAAGNPRVSHWEEGPAGAVNPEAGLQMAMEVAMGMGINPTQLAAGLDELSQQQLAEQLILQMGMQMQTQLPTEILAQMDPSALALAGADPSLLAATGELPLPIAAAGSAEGFFAGDSEHAPINSPDQSRALAMHNKALLVTGQRTGGMTEDWLCKCGFKNSYRNAVCGGNGPVGCKTSQLEGAVPSAATGLRRTGTLKHVPCKFYEAGKCAKGDDCQFFHSPSVDPAAIYAIKMKDKRFVPGSLFLPRISDGLEAYHLQAYFSQYGKIVNVFGPLRKTHVNPVAYIKFEDPAVVETVLMYGEDHFVRGNLFVRVERSTENENKVHGKRKYEQMALDAQFGLAGKS